MKIAVLSDIHGNLAALDAVLDDIEAHNVDLIVNLGDSLSGPLQPRETASRLMALGLPTIRGNHERQLLDPNKARMGLSDRFAAEAITEAQRAWIAALPGTLRIPGGVQLVHGTPASDLDYFLETVEEGGCRPAIIEEVVARLGTTDASLVICGHTHLPRIVRLPDGRQIVNPGSVGLQAYEDTRPCHHVMEAGSPHARYAVVARTDGEWSAQLLEVAYDWETAAGLAAARGRDDWARALRTGRV
jgi:predicted phosphodiesterase